ncbi:ankyrin repeat-containing protein At5g02620-like [Ananas comosus]|uniref:Ankyrin repeat-containing protein At5g02620-like n=1 Tax=Ananas comosus TaxID=4615 RepID=A0A6P5GPD0_ANACO|nr:ankyrin repeat-containing protein At5g02620-like [Ananas comosus]
MHSRGKRGDTPLHIAAREGSITDARKILSQCDDADVKDVIVKQNQDGETPLYLAAERGHVGVVREILKVSDMHEASVKAGNSFDALHIAAKQGHLDVLKELLQTFRDLAMTTNSANSTALDTAAAQGHIEIVTLLLETDASLAKIARNNGKTVLHSATRLGHLQVVKTILSKDPSIVFRIDKKGQTAFHMAVKGRNVEVVMALLRLNPSVINARDKKGNTPLHVAARKGRYEILQALLSTDRININAVNRSGETALSIAEKSSNENITSLLREAGAIAIKVQPNPSAEANKLKQTVSDIKHEVQFQLCQTHQTELRVKTIKRRLQKLHSEGLNNAINSNTVVAVLIASVAFAAIFTVPGQYVGTPAYGLTLGQANVANTTAFIFFLVFDSLALFISLAVVVVQTSLIIIEERAKRLIVFVINKLMWLACLFLSASFMSLAYIVVGRHECWLAYMTAAIGAFFMLTSIGAMCYCILVRQVEKNSARNIRRGSGSRSVSWSLSMASESEMLNGEYVMYAL